MFRLSWAWGSSGPRSKLHCGIRYDGFGCLVLGLKGFLMQEFAKTDRPWPDILGLFHNVRFSFGILTRVDSGISYKIRTKEFSTAAIWKKILFVFTAVPWQRNCYFEAAGNHLARLAIAPERLPSADSLAFSSQIVIEAGKRASGNLFSSKFCFYLLVLNPLATS